MTCEDLRCLLAEGGPEGLAGNRAAEDHLVDCAACFAVLEALAEVDRLLPELPGLDVDDRVVQSLLARPELATRAGAPARGGLSRLRAWINRLPAIVAGLHPLERAVAMLDRARRARLRWGIVAVPAVVLIGVVSVLTWRSAGMPEARDSSRKLHVVQMRELGENEVGEDTALEGLRAERQRLLREKPGKVELLTKDEAEVEELDRQDGDDGAAVGQVSEPAVPGARRRAVPIPDPTPEEPVFVDSVEGFAEEEIDFVPDDNLILGVPEALSPRFAERDAEAGERMSLHGSDSPRVRSGDQRPAISQPPRPRTVPVPGSEAEKKQKESGRSSMAENRQSSQSMDDFRSKLAELDTQVQALQELGDIEEAARLRSHLQELRKGVDEDKGTGRKNDTVVAAPVPSRVDGASPEPSFDDSAVAAARAFLAERAEVDGLTFREARGYWANTYVPGDRTLRQLKARLDRAAAAGHVAGPHDASRQIAQPFDPPDGAALAVYLHGDRRGVTARERMLVQVGIQGTARRSGVRPAMNIGLVLDLRGGVDQDTATAIRALLAAFTAGARLGDRFSLTVAGRPGGTILPPGDLRHGPLTVALGELFSDDAHGPVLSLEGAAAEALDIVRGADDPNAPLGSSAVIIITARTLGDAAGPLVSMAHRSAVDGAPWSVIGIGEGVDVGELDAVVLAGQGNRRLLAAAADAEALVDRELTAVSRVVARAVRLRIRLAPGVQLVDVIGSERLDERRAQRVRDAEQSIDQRLSRNLGIQADRGLDEEGIQIVIPSFYADDAHVVLLDVVVPGSGPVADVTARYKDLVHMKNGVARAHLRVGRSEEAVGPLELNVLTNLVATEVAARLERAADAATGGRPDVATVVLTDALNLVRGLTLVVDGLAQDRDLIADIELLEDFLGALSAASNGSDQLRLIADSLRYAGRLKVLPPPTGGDQPIS